MTLPGAVSTSRAVRLCRNATTSAAPNAAAAKMSHLQTAATAAGCIRGQHLTINLPWQAHRPVAAAAAAAHAVLNLQPAHLVNLPAVQLCDAPLKLLLQH